ELMANDFDCSIDYLINEAMRFYARSKNYQAPAGSSLSGMAPASAMPTMSQQQPVTQTPLPQQQPTQSRPPPPPPPPPTWTRPPAPPVSTSPVTKLSPDDKPAGP